MNFRETDYETALELIIIREISVRDPPHSPIYSPISSLLQLPPLSRRIHNCPLRTTRLDHFPYVYPQPHPYVFP